MSPLLIPITDITITAIVVAFIPPAVEPGQPPINIRIIVSILPDCDNCDKSKPANPAVLVVADIKPLDNNFSGNVIPFR